MPVRDSILLVLVLVVVLGNPAKQGEDENNDEDEGCAVVSVTPDRKGHLAPAAGKI